MTKKRNWAESPVIPAGVYYRLPKLLMEVVDPMPNKRARDVLLISTLVSLGSVFPNVSGLYDRSRVYPNLYSFILAGAGSDKSVMLHAQTLIEGIHDFLSKERKKTIAEALRHNKKHPDDVKAVPKDHNLIIPGNTSASALMNQLSNNDGLGILIEEEADTISNSLNQDWGNYSDFLRKAYHHGRISQQRVSAKTIEVAKPKLSVCISGTPGQATGIIKSSEDGLSSRFIYYVYEADDKWRDVTPSSDNISYDEYYESLGQRMLKQFVKNRKVNYTFHFTDSQWVDLNKKYDERLQQYPDISAVVKRLGLIQFRIAMILSIIRQFENDNPTEDIVCNSQDYMISSEICDVILEHDILFINALPKAKPQLLGRDRLLGEMKDQTLYTRTEIRTLSVGIGAEKTISNYLKQLINDGKIEKIKHNQYRKTRNT